MTRLKRNKTKEKFNLHFLCYCFSVDFMSCARVLFWGVYRLFLSRPRSIQITDYFRCGDVNTCVHCHGPQTGNRKEVKFVTIVALGGGTRLVPERAASSLVSASQTPAGEILDESGLGLADQDCISLRIIERWEGRSLSVYEAEFGLINNKK